MRSQLKLSMRCLRLLGKLLSATYCEETDRYTAITFLGIPLPTLPSNYEIGKYQTTILQKLGFTAGHMTSSVSIAKVFIKLFAQTSSEQKDELFVSGVFAQIIGDAAPMTAGGIGVTGFALRTNSQSDPNKVTEIINFVGSDKHANTYDQMSDVRAFTETIYVKAVANTPISMCDIVPELVSVFKKVPRFLGLLGGGDLAIQYSNIGHASVNCLYNCPRCLANKNDCFNTDKTVIDCWRSMPRTIVLIRVLAHLVPVDKCPGCHQEVTPAEATAAAINGAPPPNAHAGDLKKHYGQSYGKDLVLTIEPAHVIVCILHFLLREFESLLALSATKAFFAGDLNTDTILARHQLFREWCSNKSVCIPKLDKKTNY